MGIHARVVCVVLVASPIGMDWVYSRVKRHRKWSAEKMREWLASLSLTELIQALVHPADDELFELVRLHPPPPTPIHGAVFRGHDVRLRSVQRQRRARQAPRLFQCREGQILARKCVGADGTRYSLPCSREQGGADDGLLSVATVVQDPQSNASWLCINEALVDSKRRLLRWLHVASRGHFLSAPPTKNSLPAWLRPDERWNTLAMHLSARFEGALWKSYREQRLPRIPNLDDTEPRVLQAACRAALRQNLLQDDVSFIQTTTIYNLLELALLARRWTGSLWTRPLADLYTDTDDFRLQLQHHYRDAVAVAAEQELLSDLLEENQATEKPRKKKRRSKRRKKKSRQTASPAPVDPPDQPTENEDSRVNEDENDASRRHTLHAALTTMNRARNRRTVLCLSILNDVMEEVFVQVGLSEDKNKDTDKSEHAALTEPLKPSAPEEPSRNNVETQVPLNDVSVSENEEKKSNEINLYPNRTLKRKNTFQSHPSIWATFPGVGLPRDSRPTTTGSIQSAASNPHSQTSMFHWPEPLDITWDDFMVEPPRARSDVGHRDDDSESRHAHHEAEVVSSSENSSASITTAVTPKLPLNDETHLREERDAYRDMCLTLGAEVSKLKNLLAAQRGMSTIGHFDPFAVSPHATILFDPDSVARFAQAGPKARTLGAMSEAGYRADYESLASEDDPMGKVIGARQMSGTVAGSDISVELSTTHLGHPASVCMPTSKDLFDPVSLNGMQSRLSNDILSFMSSTNIQLRNLRLYRQKAIDRISRLVNAVWPRAQVKLYGSHVTGLCLPFSDLDFVVCLPAVHKNAPAQTAGALEGRNAINETSHKLLARKLKSESWIDPRSLKLIERTAVPVIKVATKDTRARTLQLDISFDGPGHHGLAAIDMVNEMLQELPMARPLILILKHFLNDRGLLTAFTGGLSSYGLFLLVSRYLQEQQSSFGDAGSLLMGFLDFYGNHFDPRTTGVSVKHRMYFPRPNLARMQSNHMWNQQAFAQIQRRNSFSDREFHGQHPAAVAADQIHPEHGMSYNLDPLLIEDPLSTGNNVGRNAFRIFQIQRAFSDAHRALVASLEWEMQSSEETPEYPLLRCLLHNEDTIVDI